MFKIPIVDVAGDESHAKLPHDHITNEQLQSDTGNKIPHTWYYVIDGQRQGPATILQLQELANSRNLRPDSLIWMEGFSDWVRADTVKELAFAPSVPTSSMPPALPSQSSRDVINSRLGDNDNLAPRDKLPETSFTVTLSEHNTLLGVIGGALLLFALIRLNSVESAILRGFTGRDNIALLLFLAGAVFLISPVLSVIRKQ